MTKQKATSTIGGIAAVALTGIAATGVGLWMRSRQRGRERGGGEHPDNAPGFTARRTVGAQIGRAL